MTNPKSTLIAASVFAEAAGVSMNSFFPKDPLAGIDIEKEYDLIQQKKSTLSSTKRRMVVERYLVILARRLENEKPKTIDC